MAPNTGRFSMQFAWARVPRWYQPAPSRASGGKEAIPALAKRMRPQRYTPTVAIRSASVQAANPSSVHWGMVMSGGSGGSHDRRQRRLDAQHLRGRRHARQQLAEVRMPHARDDVLPAIGT